MIIKKITKADKKRVLEISSKIWEGDDYLPDVFDEWINDRSGLFTGLWQDNILIAFGRMKYITPTDAWLEGLRKDQDLKIKGVGEKLARYFLNDLSKRKNLSSIRFSTYFDNDPSIKLNEKLGFEKVLTLSLKYLNIKKRNITNISPYIKKADDFPKILNFVEKSEYLKKNRNFISKGWVIYPYSRDLLKQFFFENKILIYEQKSVIKGIAIIDESAYKDVLWISFLYVENQKIFRELLKYLKKLGLENTKNEIEILVPPLKKIKTILKESKFSSWEQDNDIFLFELPLEKLEMYGR